MSVFGIEFSALSQAELVRVISADRLAPGSGLRTVVTANLDHVVTLPRNADFRSAYRHAWAATADGAPVYAYAKLRGTAAPERVTGAGLIALLLPALNPAWARVFFVASDADTADRLRDYLISRGFSHCAVGQTVPPQGFEQDESYSERLRERIRSHGTTHLIFGVGSPKSEIWIHSCRDHLGDCYALSVGAALQFFARTRRRAPVWMQKAGFEWVWRLGLEPRRLWRRYLLGGLLFFGEIRSDLGLSLRRHVH